MKRGESGGRTLTSAPARLLLRMGSEVEDVTATRLGRTRNRVAVTSSTSDPNLSYNRAGALAIVLPSLSPRFTG